MRAEQELRTTEPRTVWVVEPGTDLTDYEGAPFPTKVHLSLCSDCNLACKHCARSHWECGGMMMSKTMLEGIIEDFFPNISAIRIGGSDNGEQMLSPYFAYVLEQAREHDVDVELVTNATAINAKNAETIVSAAAVVHISVEGIGASYEQVRGFKWDRLVQNVDTLVEARRRASTRRPVIKLLVTTLRKYRRDYFALLEFARQRSFDLVTMRNFSPYTFPESRDSFLYYPREHNRFYARIRRHAARLGVAVACPPSIPLREANGSADRRKSCGQPFEVFGIQADGQIIACCVNPIDLGRYTPGRENVIERWKSENFVRLRRTVNSTEPLETCRGCSVVNANPLAGRPPFPTPPEVWRGRLRLAAELIKEQQYGELARRVAKVVSGAT